MSRGPALAVLGLLAFLGVLVPLLVPQAARAQGPALVADLSNHLIPITTGFSGTDVVLFGAVDGPGDVIIVVRGPDQDAVVRRRSRVAGIWINTRSVAFQNIPSFYAIATTRPLDVVLRDAERARLEIGLDHVRLEAESRVSVHDYDDFRAALIRNKQAMELFGNEILPVNFVGERLFRATLSFPANVATGVYTASIYLVRDGEVVNAQSTPLVVSRIGFSAEIFDFAQSHAFYYGVVAVLGAVLAGWLAAAAFRRG